jgi:hypothetical protein
VYQLAHHDVFAAVRQDWAIKVLLVAPDVDVRSAVELFPAALSDPTDARLPSAVSNALDGVLSDQARARWLAVGWLIDAATYDAPLSALLSPGDQTVAWRVIRTLLRVDGPKYAGWERLDEGRLTTLLTLLLPVFPYKPKPEGGWSGTMNPWDGSDVVEGIISALGAVGTPSARDTLQALAGSAAGRSHRAALQRNALTASEHSRERALDHRDLKAVSAALLGGPPATLPEAVATLEAELRDLGELYRRGAGSGWRKFWNLALDGRITGAVKIKGENECRNYLLDDLQPRLTGFGMQAEAVTADDNRIDIAVHWDGRMIPVEVKLDDNPELWTAASGQLSERYINDYHAAGLGIYLVLWSGGGRGKPVTKPPGKTARPTSPAALEALLRASLSGLDTERVTVVVLDLHKTA